MDCPIATSAAARRRLQQALATQPHHAADAVADLQAVTARWAGAERERLVIRVADLALTGVPFPAALMVALAEVLDD
jgi:hypothetical protein